jgi:hypothetical protein
MTTQDIRFRIMYFVSGYIRSLKLQEKYDHFVSLKLSNFEEKLSKLSRKELQYILKNIEIISLFQHNGQLHHHLKLLKQKIKNTPKHQYHHLLPVIDFFIQSLSMTNFLYSFSDIDKIPTISRKLISDEEIKNSTKFCHLIEGAGLLLNEIGYFELINIKTNLAWYQRLIWIMLFLISIIILIAITFLLISFGAMIHGNPIGIGILIISAILSSLPVTLIGAFYVNMIPNFYEYSLFKLNLSNLRKFLSNIQLDEKISEWALLEINKLNKLPTQAVAHIGSFFANGERIEKKLFDKKHLDEQSSQPSLTD